ncbi:MAG TPA: hypothetical protein VFR81_02205 [Longimicrobium sp.]|nr:hypothetical protein [Longimicrobium sp.]
MSEEREIRIRDRAAVTLDEFYRCGSCGEEFYLPGMMDAVLQRAKACIRAKDS